MIFTLLFIFWIILNERISLEIVLLGLFISLAITILTYKTTRMTKQVERKMARNMVRLIQYLIILIIEVIKANIDIIKLVLSKDPEITPTLKIIKVGLKSRISRVALANSITLTPGTITVSMDEDQLLIHAIKKSNLDGIEESVFVEKLEELEE